MKEYFFDLLIVALSACRPGCRPPSLYLASVFLGITHPKAGGRLSQGCRAQFEKKGPSIKLNGDKTAILTNAPVFDGF
jgi:hypothetical protein